MLLNQRLSHLAEQDAGHHSHRSRTDTETLTGFHLVIILHGLQANLFQPLPTLGFQFGQFHLSLHQRQQMGNLDNAVALAIGEHIQIIRKRSKRIVRGSCHGNTALKAIRIIVHHTIKRIGRSTHHYIP